MKRERIDLRVRADVKENWQQEAKKDGISLSELIHRRMSLTSRRKVVKSP